MGFKFKRIDLVAGSSEFPTTDTSYTGRRARSIVIIQKIGQAILDCNCGWVLDGGAESVLEFDDIPSKVSGETYPGLFFKNTTSGCKLFVAYIANRVQNGMRDFGGTGADLFQCNSGTNRFVSSLCMSMIPEGSTSEFGSPYSTDFLPADATRIIGTDVTYSNDNDYGGFGAEPTAGWIYSYGIFVSPYAIAVSCTKAQSNPGNLGIPSYCVGRIFGTLAHSSDNTNQAKYGVVTFRVKNNINTSSEGTYSPMTYTISSYLGDNNMSLSGVNQSYGSFSNYLDWDKACCSFAKADGTWINGCDMTAFNTIYYPSNPVQLSGYVFNSTNNGKSRWVPYEVVVLSSDLDTYGIVPGDGFKGYLDTDLFRCAKGTYGQMFDNGNFICADGTYNFLIGWDSTNTDSITG
jgi:hypothetical protein